MNKVPVFPVNTAEGGDTVYQAIVNILSELGELYSQINKLYRLSSGSSPPSGAEVSDVWIDTSGAVPALKRLASTGPDTWENLGDEGSFDSGVDLDDGLAGWGKGLICSRVSGTTLRVTASATAPAVVMIDGVLCRNTAAADCSFSGAANGEHVVYAEREGSGSTFKLGRVTKGTSLAATRVKIAEVGYYGGDFGFIESVEHRPGQTLPGDGLFHICRTAAQSIPYNAHTTVQLNSVVVDKYSQYSASDYGVIIKRAGWWQIDGATRIESAAQKSTLRVMTGLKKNGTHIQRDDLKLHDINTNTIHLAPGGIYLLDFGDVLTLTCYQTTEGGNNYNCEPEDAAYKFHVALWGRFLGPA